MIEFNKKKLLIAGGGYADIPLILAAKKLGFYVITSGNRPNDMGHQYSNEYRMADFSDCDAILKLAKRLKISAICPCCNDFSALSAAYTAGKMGLPGHDPYRISQIIHHKDLYRKFALENGIASPRASWFTNKKDALKGMASLPLPVVIKPVNLSGGKGISTVNRMEESEKAVEKAFTILRTQRIVVEEFIEGERHGFSAFLVNGRVVFFFSDNEHYFLNPYMVAAASTPSTVSSEVENNLCIQSEKIASLLSLTTGIFHLQYILRNEEPIIIEICRRAPGDLYIKLVEYATGVDYSSWIVRAFAGMDCSDLEQASVKGFFTRHCVMAPRDGTLKNIVFDSSLDSMIIDKLMWWNKGEQVVNHLTTKFGIVFLEFRSQDEMMKTTDRLHELIVAQIG